MDYEEKYNKALGKARQLCAYPTTKPFINDLQNLFPELKDSEDETIRKRLIRYFRTFRLGTFAGLEPKKIIDWLEKQGESDETKAKVFLINKGYPIDANGVFPTYEEMYNIIREGLEQQGEQIPANSAKTCKDEQKPNPYSGTSFDYDGHTWGMCARDNGVELLLDGELKAFLSLEKSFIYPLHSQPELAPKSAMEAAKEEKVDNAKKKEPKKIEQKPWSEEDNFMYNKIKNLLTDISLAPESIKSLFDWLKDLRDRVQPQTTWKPSDEQLKVLDEVIKNPHLSATEYNILTEIEEQLKKLREE